MSNTFNTGDIITHKDSTDDNRNRYYYVVLNTFHRYTIEYYNLFCFVTEKEVTLSMDDSKHYHVVSSVS
jgi:hypothetical protein